MTTTITDDLGLVLPVVGSGEQWSTGDLNDNLLKLEQAAVGAQETIAGRLGAAVSDLDALALLTGTPMEIRGVIEGGALFQWRSGWRQITPATFANAADRDTAYDKAAGAFRVYGAQVRRSDRGWLEGYHTTGTASFNTKWAGWFPLPGTGPMPRSRYATVDGNVAMGIPTYATGIGFMGTAQRTHPDIVKDGTDDLKLVVPGTYEFTTHITIAGDPPGWEHQWLSAVDAAPTVFTSLTSKFYGTSAPAAYTTQHQSAEAVTPANARVRLRMETSDDLTGVRFFDTFWNEVRYVSPPFVDLPVS